MFYTIKENTEAYRSGHNEAVLKTVWAQAHGGSSPSASAKAKKPRIVCGIFCVLAEETELKRFLVAYCRRKADIRRGSHACVGNGVILSFKFKQGSMPSVQGVFGRDRILRTCKVRVHEDCLQPEEIGFEEIRA